MSAIKNLPQYTKGTHKQGESTLNQNPPPSGATGLIIDQWLTKIDWKPWLSNKVVFFIFRDISGSHDYATRDGDRCGGFQAKMGYWWFDTAEERDIYYEALLNTELFNRSRSEALAHQTRQKYACGM